MKAHLLFWFFCLLFLSACQSNETTQAPSLISLLEDSPHKIGKAKYLASPYVTAGNRLYMVGHQDGSFPDLGWHIPGEMGGIWDHPIKLMDGFQAQLRLDQESICLNKADTFINFPYANIHLYRSLPQELQIDRLQFVPDDEEAVYIEYFLHNSGSATLNAQLEIIGMSDLRPVWLGEENGVEDGQDIVSWEASKGCMLAKDSLHNWYAVWGSKLPSQQHQINTQTCSQKPMGKGVNASMMYTIQLNPGEKFSLPLVIAGSYESKDKALATYDRVLKEAKSLLSSKQKRFQTLQATSRLSIPDQDLQEVYEWVKYNTDWLIREVPEQGRALSAGIPDYPWWFGCDNTYTLQGLLASGRPELSRSSLDLLKKLSEKNNDLGRVIHEASTNGIVFNPGNLNETPHFASMVRTHYDWTGDQDFLKTYFPFVKKGMEWLLRENDKNQDLYPDGFGMMEIHGLNSAMIDVAVYTQQGYEDAAFLADALDETETAQQFDSLAQLLKSKINQEFWVPEFNSYADFIGTTEQALELIDAAMVRADTLDKPWAVEELRQTRAKIENYPPDQKQGFVLYHNWVVNTPMEMGIADPDKALKALETGSQFVNPFGMFVTGIDRDDSAGDDTASFAQDKKIFSYVGAVMTLPTGVQAISENNYGRPDKALGYLKRLIRSFNYALPGSMYEVSPDFGMIAQAWNIYSLGYPIIRQFFGIHPQAWDQRVLFRPTMPSTWTQASLEEVPVGDNQLSMVYKKTAEGLKIRLKQSKPGWKLLLQLPQGTYTTWLLNQEEVSPESEGAYDQVVCETGDCLFELK